MDDNLSQNKQHGSHREIESKFVTNYFFPTSLHTHVATTGRVPYSLRQDCNTALDKWLSNHPGKGSYFFQELIFEIVS